MASDTPAAGVAPLAGKTAVITGASSGIGRAIAELLGSSGAHVVMGGRTAAALDESVARIAARGGTAEAHTGDIRQVDVARDLVDRAVQSTGRLDVMVNNAGVSFPEPILEGDPEHWRTMLETNVLALLVGSQAAVKAMRACGARGHIVNISSGAAQRRDSGVYGSTKHAVNCISETLRQELKDDPIQVVTVMPGAIATSFARNFDPAVLQTMVAVAAGGGGSGAEELASVELTQGERLPDELVDAARAAMPDHLCAPEDVAEAVLWAITRPPTVHVPEVSVRPNRDLAL
ncbi:MAG TPA: SDR family oxidoreductase [Acidimicrobiales bacterium]|nr:SDR family oxidoreductase [Acidimicrobiales bacterium]